MDYSYEKSKAGSVSAVLIFISILSQIPSLVDTSLSRYLSLGSFLALFLFVALKRKRLCIPRVITFIYLSFALFLAAASLLSPKYFSSSHIYPMFLSLFVLVIGSFLSQSIGKADFISIYNGYIYGSLCVCVDLFLNYFRSASFDSYTYIYGSKNSVSQILVTAFILILFIKLTQKTGVVKLIYILLELFILYLLLSLKSRATIVAIPLVIIIFVFSKNINLKLRLLLVVLSIAFVIALLCNTNFYNTIINQILLNSRQGESLDVISSGRLSLVDKFIERIQGNWFFGIGASYVESYPLSIILNFGIIIGSMLIYLSLYPVLLPISKLKSGNYSEHTILLFTVAITYWINSLFEQLAPFGPGGKCFFLWLLVGLYVEGNAAFLKKID